MSTAAMCCTAMAVFLGLCFLGVTFMALTAPHGVEDDSGYHEVE